MEDAKAMKTTLSPRKTARGSAKKIKAKVMLINMQVFQVLAFFIFAATTNTMSQDVWAENFELGHRSHERSYNVQKKVIEKEGKLKTLIKEVINRTFPSQYILI